MSVMDLLQQSGIPLPLGVALIIVILTILYVAFNKFLDRKASWEITRKERTPVTIVPAAPAAGNNATIAAISAAVNEYRKNNL